jgi:hypothetical protein
LTQTDPIPDENARVRAKYAQEWNTEPFSLDARYTRGYNMKVCLSRRFKGDVFGAVTHCEEEEHRNQTDC